MKSFIFLFILIFNYMYGFCQEKVDKPQIIIINPAGLVPLKTDADFELGWEYKVKDSVNISDALLKAKFKLSFSINNGADWTDISLDIPTNAKVVKVTLPDSIISRSTDEFLLKISDTKGQFSEGQSKRLKIKKKETSDNITFFPGANFSASDNAIKLNGFYFGIQANFPKVWGKWGTEFYFAQGQTFQKDTNKITSDTNYSLNYSSTENSTNTYLAASVKMNIDNNFILYLPHIEIRRISSSISVVDKRKNSVIIRLQNPVRDSVITTQTDFTRNGDDTRFDYFLGTGLGFTSEQSNFNLNFKSLIGYNASSLYVDLIFRFCIRENITGIKFGGDIRTPFFGVTDESKNRYSKNEILIYLSKEISIKDLYNTIVKTK